jgi:hypothetical protein
MNWRYGSSSRVPALASAKPSVQTPVLPKEKKTFKNGSLPSNLKYNIFYL